MIKLGLGKDGNVLYMGYEEFEKIIKNPLEYKTKLNNQQWAKLRKKIRKVQKA